MRPIVTAILCAILTTSMAACNGSTVPPTSPPPPSAPATTPVPIEQAKAALSEQGNAVPASQMPPTLLPFAGSWFIEDWATRLTITHDGATTTISLYDYDLQREFAGKSAMVRPDGTLVFSGDTPARSKSIYKHFFQAVVMDAATLRVSRSFDGGVGHSDTDNSTSAVRSKAQGAKRDPSEERRIGQIRAREELMAFVESIVTAEVAYHAAFGHFIYVAEWPRPQAQLDSKAVPWPQGSDFDTLGISFSDYGVRGCYSVELTDRGSGIIVHGWADGDGDGIRAHVTATESQRAVLQTQEEIY